MSTVKIVKSDRVIGGLTTMSAPITKTNVDLTQPITITTEFESPLVTVVVEDLTLNGSVLTIEMGGEEYKISEDTDYATYTFPLNTSSTTINLSATAGGVASLFKAYQGDYISEVVTLTPLVAHETKKVNLGGWFVEAEFDTLRDTEHIQQDYIMLVKTKSKGEQPFRIHNIEKDADTIYVHANHVAFDAHTYVIKEADIQSLSAVLAMDIVNRNTDPISPFSMAGNVGGSLSANYSKKTLFEALDDIQKTWGGTWDIDGWTFYLRESMGRETGLHLNYGKNIEGLRYLENWDGVVTKIYPISNDGMTIDPILSKVQYTRLYSKAVEFPVEIPEERKDDPVYKEEVLRNLATSYLETSQFPKISVKVTSNIPQNFDLMDNINISHPAITKNIDVETGLNADQTVYPIKVLAYVYNVLTERVVQLEYGDYTSNTYTLFTDRIDLIQKEVSKNIVDQDGKLREQEEYIRNMNKNGHVYIDDNTIYLLDTLPKEDAKTVWMIGNGGIAVSETGIDGEFKAAWDLKSGFNADFITAGTLNANLIATNSIKSEHLSIDAIDMMVNLAKGGGKNRIRASAFLGEAPHPWKMQGVTTKTIWTGQPDWTAVYTNNLVPNTNFSNGTKKYHLSINPGNQTSDYTIPNANPGEHSRYMHDTWVMLKTPSPEIKVLTNTKFEAPSRLLQEPIEYMNPQGEWVETYMPITGNNIDSPLVKHPATLYPAIVGHGPTNVFLFKISSSIGDYMGGGTTYACIIKAPIHIYDISYFYIDRVHPAENEAFSAWERRVVDGKVAIWGFQNMREGYVEFTNSTVGKSDAQYRLNLRGKGGGGTESIKPRVFVTETDSTSSASVTLDYTIADKSTTLVNLSGGAMGVRFQPHKSSTGAIALLETGTLTETLGANVANTQVLGETSSWASQYTSGFATLMFGDDTILSQTITLDAKATHTFAFKVKKVSVGGLLSIDLWGLKSGGVKDSLVSYKQGSGETLDDIKIYTLDSLGLHYEEVLLEIRVQKTLINDKTMLTDLVLREGVEAEWESADGESITTNFIMNEDGFSVVRRDGNTGAEIGRTVMSPFDFSGYYNNRRIFSLNGDITETEGLLVRSKGLFIPPVKMVQNGAQSLDIVWTGPLKE